jgi:hypothetical protein
VAADFSFPIESASFEVQPHAKMQEAAAMHMRQMGLISLIISKSS